MDSLLISWIRRVELDNGWNALAGMLFSIRIMHREFGNSKADQMGIKVGQNNLPFRGSRKTISSIPAEQEIGLVAG
jgi:hypothetical protein